MHITRKSTTLLYQHKNYVGRKKIRTYSYDLIDIDSQLHSNDNNVKCLFSRVYYWSRARTISDSVVLMRCQETQR